MLVGATRTSPGRVAKPLQCRDRDTPSTAERAGGRPRGGRAALRHLHIVLEREAPQLWCTVRWDGWVDVVDCKLNNEY